MTRKILIGISIFLCVATAHADAIARLKSFIASTRSGQATFTQELLDRKGKRIQFVTGTMQFVRPGKFRWSYQKPYEQLIVGNGEKFWLYDVDLNQVTEKKLDAALGSSPAALLSGNNDIERSFALSDISCDGKLDATQLQPASAPIPAPASAPASTQAPAADAHAACVGGRDNGGLEWLEAIPHNQEASIEKIRMAFNQRSDLVVVELYDTFGHNTVLHFSNLQRNPKLSPKLFTFEPPQDADILSDE